MIWVDYAIISVIVISALISLVRGFFRESLSLITWICAFIIAGYFYPSISHYFTYFSEPYVRGVCAIVTLFLGTLFVGMFLNVIVYKLVSYTGLSGTDRVLGIFFGVARGILLIAIVLFVIDAFTPFSENEAWQSSKLIPYFDDVVKWIFGYLQQSSVLLH